jgi:hypothetical protein
MSGTELARAFRELVAHLGGSVVDVYLRIYEYTPGESEAGAPPQGTYTDTKIEPRPIVLDLDAKGGEGLREDVAGHRDVHGMKRIIMPANVEVQGGGRLWFDGSEWEVMKVRAPVLYGEVMLKLVLARRLVG